MRKGCFRRIGGTDKAYLLYPPEDKKQQFWIPRSVLSHVSVLQKSAVGEHELVQIEVEDWWVRKHRDGKLDKYFS